MTNSSVRIAINNDRECILRCGVETPHRRRTIASSRTYAVETLGRASSRRVCRRQDSGPGHAHRQDRPSRVLSSPATSVICSTTAPEHVQASLRLRWQRETSMNGYSATIGLSGELLMQSLRHLPQRRVNFMRGIIVCQLRQCFSKVAALILTTSSNQLPASHKLIELVNGAKSIVFRRDL
ncbi:hypothetical protein E4U35_000813 [Claviceps purpurea]|nr:hypothetical protein E4U35_000813 [Claviceps purpurea]